LAVTVTVWLDVTADAVSRPLALIVAYDVVTLHVGMSAVVAPSSHVPVAAYVPAPPSSIDVGPLTVTLVRTAGGGVTAGTIQGYAGEYADSSPVLRTAFAVK